MNQLLSSNAIVAAWDATLARKSADAAIFDASGGLARSFADIEAEARLFEGQAQSFSPGDAIGVQIGNSESWPALLLALFRLRLVPLPLGRHVEGGELKEALETCGVAGLAVIENGRVSVRSLNGEKVSHRCEFLKLTSGTTSAPRAVRFQSRQLLADCANICVTMGISDGDLNFGVIPFSHSYGFSNLVTPLLCRGVPLVASEDRMPRAILHDLECSGATVFPGMPVFFDKLSAMESCAPLSKLRLCISAGAPLPPNVAAAFSEQFGLKIHTFYGSSECGGIGYDRSPEPIYKTGFAGEPMDGVNVERESNADVGRITITGPAVADGYFPESDVDTLGGGRFTPGDLVTWDDRGMTIVGRSSDVINIAGRKLNPGEVENRISAFAGVRQVVVFGVPSQLRGEEPVACIEGHGIDRAALQRFCQAQLSQWQVPRDLWIVPEIPTNERGKVSRRMLAERYAARAGKPI